MKSVIELIFSRKVNQVNQCPNLNNFSPEENKREGVVELNAQVETYRAKHKEVYQRLQTRQPNELENSILRSHWHLLFHPLPHQVYDRIGLLFSSADVIHDLYANQATSLTRSWYCSDIRVWFT